MGVAAANPSLLVAIFTAGTPFCWAYQAKFRSVSLLPGAMASRPESAAFSAVQLALFQLW